MLTTFAMVALAQVPAPAILSPWDAVRLAWQDVQTVPLPRRMYTRYLSFYDKPLTERANYIGCLNFLVNSLSREKILTRVHVVDSENSLVRIFLDDYSIDGRKFDSLVQQGSGPAASRTPEPYFYTQLVQDVDVFEEKRYVYRDPPRYDAYRRPLARLPDREVVEKVKTGTRKEKRQAAAPWIAPDGGRAIAYLVAATQSPTPIVRGDWFIANSSISPGYYNLLGLGDFIKDFEKLVFADSKLAEQARSQVKGVVVFSPVALHNRSLTRMPTVAATLGGYYWESHDTNKSVDDRDYVNVLLDEKYDATEVIASLPCGLQAYFLTDGKGKRLDVAVAGVAIDSETILQDRQIFSARNCIVCHASGIRPINDEVRVLSRDKIALLVPDPKQARRIADLYFSHDLGAVVEHDQQLFSASVRAVNGWTGAANGAVFERIVHTYVDAPLTPEVVAREAGVPLDHLKNVLATATGLDHTLTGLLQNPPRPVRRDQWEQSGFSQMMLLLQGNRP